MEPYTFVTDQVIARYHHRPVSIKAPSRMEHNHHTRVQGWLLVHYQVKWDNFSCSGLSWELYYVE